MIRPAAILCALALLPAGPAVARAASGSPGPAAAALGRAHVIYLAGASVYVDAGRAEGLGEGDTLVVRRAGLEVARLRAGVVSTHRSSCDTLVTRGEIKLGDEAGFAVRAATRDSLAAPPAAPLAAAAPAGASRMPASRARPWATGRVGVSWLAVRDASSRFDQPMLDLRLDGGGDGAFITSVDLRGRQTTQVTGSGSSRDVEARFYRASITMREPSERVALTLGRLSSPSLAPVSIFDGALLEGGSRRLRVGAFGGTQPDPEGMRLSSTIREFGGYLEARQAPLAQRRWDVGLGAISSYDSSQTNRDFMFAQGFFQDRRFSGSILQEADFARGWKRAQGEPAFSFTSTYASAQMIASRWISFQTGFDNRRNVRLWRDHLTPETEFDDRFRQGVWVGASARLPQGFGVSADQRWRAGGGDLANTTTLGAELQRPTWSGLSLRGRWSDYQGPPIQSKLLSGSIGMQAVRLLHVEVAGGQRRTDDAAGGGSDLTHWWSSDLDLTLARLWFANFSYQSERSEFVHTIELWAGLSRRL
ncbi:MAG TPA: hypothetical protein VMJ70_14085 [Candidatus Sulfotelmatobacter sp.]|nr:hypothetical protein [Candidatus Sulfotelmatobacter sp.]